MFQELSKCWDRVTNSATASFTGEVIWAGQLMLNRSIPGEQEGAWGRISTIKTAWARTEVGESKACWEMVRCSWTAYRVRSRKLGCKMSQLRLRRAWNPSFKKFGVNLEGTRGQARVLTKEKWWDSKYVLESYLWPSCRGKWLKGHWAVSH